ncbi:uncharacterized protein LOC121330804 isoform X2 [Polyodon spathula]|uniref:uncharacterized protein LOC121330804 isoform X2 n=1 Tax=Polyodon spathula TaxID=7913 RepID=UPI001B7DC1C2|nr:uncharacterized protein LOC121330804 isoform X2 [Polyodon spathula]
MGYHSVCISVVVSIIFGCFTKSTFAQCNTIQENATVICAGVKSCAIESFLAAGNFANGLCDYTIIDYACSSVEHFVGKDLANLLNCTVNNNVKFTKEALKLFFTRVSGVLDSALDAYSNATTSPSLSKALILDVLGELRVNSFSPENLTDMDFIKQWFLVRFKPFLASASVDFLSCLSTKNFSCETYQAVVTELNNEFSNMDNKGQQWVYTYFINPFLSSSNASGSTCISSTSNSRQWLQKNYGHFVVFAKYKDFVNLNSNFSGVEALALLSPGQVAELTVDPSVGALDNVVIINQVFDMLQNHSHGRELEDFFTMFVLVTAQRNITAIYNTDVRMVMLNRTFAALSPEFPTFSTTEWEDWFQVKLVLLLPSVSPGILAAIPNNISCDSYQAIIKGLDHALKSSEQSHLNSSLLLPPPKGCPGHLEKLDLLSPEEISSLILDPKVGALESVGIINQIFDRLQNDSNARELDLFFIHFVYLTQKDNVTVIKNTDVRMVMLNRTFAALSPAFPTFSTTEWEDWFQVKLVLLLPSVNPGILAAIPNNISCDSYQAIVKGLDNVFTSLSHGQTQAVFNFIKSYLMQPFPEGSSCVETNNISHKDWLVRNTARFSTSASYTDLKLLSKNFTGLEALAQLSPGQVAELTVDPSVGALDNVVIINQVFDTLQNPSHGRELEDFFTMFVLVTAQRNITAIYNTDVRMVMLNRTFAALSPEFPTFSTTEWEDWFQVKLVLLLPSVSPGILAAIPNNISCDSYQAIIKGLDHALKSSEQSHLNSSLLLPPPKGCPGHLEKLDLLSPEEISSLILDPKVGALESVGIINQIFDRLQNDSNARELDLFFIHFVYLTQKDNVTVIKNTDVRMVMLNRTFATLSPAFPTFSTTEWEDWFQVKLVLLLPSVSPGILAAIPNNISCDSYQAIMKGLDSVFRALSPEQSQMVFNFSKNFLLQQSPGGFPCVNSTISTKGWLERNLQRFSSIASYRDLRLLNRNFAMLEDLDVLTLLQFSQLAAAPGILNTSEDVRKLMIFLNSSNSALFFDVFIPAVQGRDVPNAVKTALIQGALDKGNLSAANDAEILRWLDIRLMPLLPGLTPNQVLLLFAPLKKMNCSTNHEAVKILSSISVTLNEIVQKEVYNTILTTLKDPTPLRCYTNNSFLVYMNDTFLNFGSFLTLTSILSVAPETRAAELVNTVTPTELSQFLSVPERIDSLTLLTEVLKNYTQLPLFIDDFNGRISQVNMSKAIKSSILRAVWTTVLSTDSEADLDKWFSTRLIPYLEAFDKNLITSSDTLAAKCLPFRKLVQVLGNSSSYYTDFDRKDVYGTIKSYLSTGTKPKCYNAADPVLNSTAWFANYLGPFIIFSSQNDINIFGSTEQLKIFADNSDNLKLMSNELIPQDVRALYSSLVFHQNPAFSITELPGALLCFAPDSGYSSVKPAELQALSERLLKACNKTLDSALDNVSSLTSLGTLVQGLPSNTIASVSPAVALSAANDPAFVQNIIRGPEVLQQIFINKIITVNSDPNVMLQNIPDDMAGLIPLPLLTFLGSTFNLEQIEKKKWKKEQASLFFHKVAITTTSYDNLSPYILQGFSCSAVQSIPNNNTVNIVKACRGKKVPLVEDQLSCMAYHVAANASPQDFTSYPVDMLLYYPYSQIPSSNCRSYFTEIGGANFYVFSETSNRPTALTNSAKNCLGITGTSLSSADLNVLNNMVCILNGSYIENSDNLILEKLKKCEQLTAGQIASVQKVLFSGTTKYGNSSTWTQKTLADLEELPLFLTSEFWSKFKQDDRKSFLKAHNNVKKGLKKELFTQLGLARRVRRAAACTAGEITTAKINEVTFPIDYDETQFSLCLANSTVKDNLALLTEKVLVENYQTVLLQKLKEAYNNSIPEDQLQLLGATSRVASVADINSWTITTADTLSALMKSEDGRWDADKSAAIITKYLAAGKTLDAVALKAIGGENLCSLSLSQLKNITAPNLRDAGALDISSCTPEKKKKLYNTASAALINQRSDVLTYYSLIKPYLGGAPLEDVLSIAQQNINMDITTFKNLDKDLILKLSPDTVKNLLGNNLRDLESQVNDPVIKEWLSRQAQSTLNSLGVSGVTGIPDPLPVGVITILKPEAAGANQLVPRVLQTLFIGMLTAALQKVL